MNVLIVLAHPEGKSFNAAMARVAEETLSEMGHHVVTTDLYAIDFEAESDRRNFVGAMDSNRYFQQREEAFAAENQGFVATLNREIDRVKAADLIIWQFPLWWFGLPAILKGYVDRVFAYGVFYGGGKVYETGVLQGKQGLISMTTGGPRREDSADNPVTEALAPMRRIQRFVGMESLEPVVTYSVSRQTEEEGAAKLAEFAAYLRATFPT